eukprot:CAMPEP_0198711684 /NCGR_PEP_ID=MMETSP1471-20131121/3710_1 /TAXON_ID=41880 /ORGANISM="Pycnococcus provasolii, Strain RCC733" /LENGTH=43 /DNA_ID= /DNA_START= /DNA_END= /DNA_ORIENTATION=
MSTPPPIFVLRIPHSRPAWIALTGTFVAIAMSGTTPAISSRAN